jgi:hypothetical protein
MDDLHYYPPQDLELEPHEILYAKLSTAEAKNRYLYEQIEALEKNLYVLNQTLALLTSYGEQKDQDLKRYSISILKKDKQMRDLLKRIERIGKIVYVLQQFGLVSVLLRNFD